MKYNTILIENKNIEQRDKPQNNENLFEGNPSAFLYVI